MKKTEGSRNMQAAPQFFICKRICFLKEQIQKQIKA